MTINDSGLLERAHSGDLESLQELLQRHLHPAWRVATIAAPNAAAAEDVTCGGVVDGLLAARRNPDPTQPLRVRIVASTRRAAALADGPERWPDDTTGDPVIAAFRALPERWRTALWLTQVEGGKPEQIAPVLGLDRSAAATLADRAIAGLRERVATDIAEHATDPACREALSKLPAHAAGKLTTSEQQLLGAHIESCGACAVWVAVLVSPRPALRRLITPVPAGLAAAIEARWLQHLEMERRGWMAPFTERTIGAAAATVLAIGLGGALLLGDRTDRNAQLAVPTGVVPSGGPGESASGLEPTPVPDLPPAAASTAAPADTGASSTTPRAASPTRPAPQPQVETPTAPPEPASPPEPSEPVPPPRPENPPPPAPEPEATQISLDVIQGTVTLGVGDCTGAAVFDIVLGCVPPSRPEPAAVEIDLPGLPPIGL